MKKDFNLLKLKLRQIFIFIEERNFMLLFHK